VKKRSGMHLSKVSLVRNQLSVDPMQEAQTPPGNSSSRLGARQLPCLTSATTRQNGERAQQPLRRRQALSQYRPGEGWRLWYVLALQLMIPSPMSTAATGGDLSQCNLRLQTLCNAPSLSFESIADHPLQLFSALPSMTAADALNCRLCRLRTSRRPVAGPFLGRVEHVWWGPAGPDAASLHEMV
jgi:hypothetical protein